MNTITAFILLLTVVFITSLVKGLFPGLPGVIGIGCALCYLIGKYEKKD